MNLCKHSSWICLLDTGSSLCLWCWKGTGRRKAPVTYVSHQHVKFSFCVHACSLCWQKLQQSSLQSNTSALNVPVSSSKNNQEKYYQQICFASTTLLPAAVLPENTVYVEKFKSNARIAKSVGAYSWTECSSSFTNFMISLVTLACSLSRVHNQELPYYWKKVIIFTSF